MRQGYDFSCGLAALATLMSWQGVAATETELLAELGDTGEAAERKISFADLATLARRRGFAAQGVAVPTESLKGLRRPAIVALQTEGRAHFSVLRAVAPDGAVLLADPTWGHRRLAAWEFRRVFEVASAPRGGHSRVASTNGVIPAAGTRSEGRLLLIGHPEAAGADRVPGVLDWRWPVRILPTRPRSDLQLFNRQL